MSTTDENYRKAKKKVAAKKGFYSHLGSFLAVMVFLFLLNVVTFHGKWWFIFPFLGWGMSVMIHYFTVFGLPFINNDEDWEEKAIRREMEKMQGRSLPEAVIPEEERLDLPELKREKDTKNWDEEDLV
mgnify:CR=1 FL=1